MRGILNMETVRVGNNYLYRKYDGLWMLMVVTRGVHLTEHGDGEIVGVEIVLSTLVDWGLVSILHSRYGVCSLI